MSQSYLWVVLRHDFSANPYERMWDDAHTVSTLSIHKSVTAANRFVMEETREDVSLTFDYDFPEDDSEIVDQDEGDGGYVTRGKHGGLIVSTSPDQNNATKVWVERQVLLDDSSDDEEEEEGDSEEEEGDDDDVVFLGIKRKNTGDPTEAGREAKKIK